MDKKKLQNTLSSFIIFAITLIFYVWFYESYQMSMSVTGNGIWKATGILEYLRGTGSLEYGDLLYYPTTKCFYLFLNKFYAVNTYDTIVLFNGLSSAVLTSCIFYFIHKIYKSYGVALFATAFHFMLPGVFFLSISNEDIFPSYTFFVFGVFSFYFYIKEKSLKYLLSTTALFAFSMLFHWTSGIPAFGAWFFYLLILDSKDVKSRVQNAVKSFFLIFILFLIISILLNVSFLGVWYPAKGTGSLWISGILLNKIPLVLDNTITFFMFGYTSKNLDKVPVFSIIVGILMFVLLYKSYSTYIVKKQLKSEAKLVHYLFIVFILGTAMNFYEQGSDPQFFIQPQFLIFWLIVMAYSLNFKNKILILSLSIFILFGILRRINNTKGKDERSLHNVRVIEKAIENHAKTVYIGRGFESFNSIAALEWGGYDSLRYLHYPEGLAFELEMSDSAYLQMAKDSINNRLDQGFNLVLIDFINMDPRVIGTSFYGYDLTTKIILLQDYFKNSYTLEKIPGTWQYDFFIMKPKDYSED